MDIRLKALVVRLIALSLLSSFLVGCSSDLQSNSSPSDSYPDVSAMSNDMLNSVIIAVKASGTKNTWKYDGGDTFTEDEYKTYVPQMMTSCGKNDNGERLYQKQVFLKSLKPMTESDYKKAVEQVSSAWAQNGYSPQGGPSDSKSQRVIIRTDNGVLVQFSGTSDGLVLDAESSCSFPEDVLSYSSSTPAT